MHPTANGLDMLEILDEAAPGLLQKGVCDLLPRLQCVVSVDEQLTGKEEFAAHTVQEVVPIGTQVAYDQPRSAFHRFPRGWWFPLPTRNMRVYLRSSHPMPSL